MEYSKVHLFALLFFTILSIHEVASSTKYSKVGYPIINLYMKCYTSVCKAKRMLSCMLENAISLSSPILVGYSTSHIVSCFNPSVINAVDISSFAGTWYRRKGMLDLQLFIAVIFKWTSEKC